MRCHWVMFVGNSGLKAQRSPQPKATPWVKDIYHNRPESGKSKSDFVFLKESFVCLHRAYYLDISKEIMANNIDKQVIENMSDNFRGYAALLRKIKQWVLIT